MLNKIENFCVIVLSVKFIIYSVAIQVDEFSSTDCYESFSTPKQYLEFFHYHLQGPSFLFPTFEFNIIQSNSLLASKISYDKYPFKRINGSCRSSLIFTSGGINITSMYLSIELKSYKYKDMFAHITYKFDYGFIPGDYVLRDMKRNYGIKARILIEKIEIPQYNKSLIDAKDFLKYYSDYNNDMCVVTEYNRELTIRPYYFVGRFNGLLTNIKISRYENNKIVYEHNFPAFGCTGNIGYPNSAIILISEKSENHTISNIKEKLKFIAVYLKFEDNEEIVKEISFIIPNAKITDFSKHEKISNYYRKFFLMDKWTLMDCPDNTERIVYEAKNGEIFYAKGLNQTEVFPYVTEYYWFTSSPSSPCRN